MATVSTSTSSDPFFSTPLTLSRSVVVQHLSLDYPYYIFFESPSLSFVKFSVLGKCLDSLKGRSTMSAPTG